MQARHTTLLHIARHLLFIIMLLLPGLSHAQAYTIAGSIRNSKDSALSGELLLLLSKNNTLIKVAAFDKGSFRIDDVNEEEVTLKISSTGAEDSNIAVSNKQHKALVDLGTIRLKDIVQLGEVNIVARTPIFENTAEGNRINVENTMMAGSATATELLSKMPGISVGGSKVNVFGKGEALIYMDGKQITYERLMSLPVGQVKSVDIISNPSAKYDAKGRAVVNVRMKKNTAEGFLWNLTQNSTWARHFLTYTSANMSYRKKKLSLSADYSINLGTDWNESITNTTFNKPAGVYKTHGYYRENTALANVSTYRLGAGYAIDDKTDISLQYDGLYNLYNLAVDNDAQNYAPSGEHTNIVMHNNGKTVNTNHSLNMNLNRKLDTLGSSFFFGGQYNNFENVLYDQISERISYPGDVHTQGQRVNDGNNRIGLYIAQFDVNKNFKNGSKLEFGGKASYVTNAGKVKFKSKYEGDADWTEYDVYANSFIYKEFVPALYVMYSGKIKKFDYSAGTRAELSRVDGYSRKLQKQVIDTTYFNLFPNARLGYTISDNWNTSLSYSYRINRPLYQDIDPFVWYIDSLTSVQGNSKLIPEFTHSLEWRLGFKAYSLKLGYAYTTNAMRPVAKSGNTGVNSVIFTKENIQHFQQYTAAVDIPLEFKGYNSYTSIACNINRYMDTRPEYRTGSTIPQLYIYTYHQLTIYKDLKADLSGEYYGKGSNGLTRFNPSYYASLGLSKNLLKDKLSCQLAYNDLFRTSRWSGTRTTGPIVAEYSQRPNVTYFRIVLTYKAGRLKNSGYKNKAVNDSEYGRIKK